uniref:Uncharacterized protein n=1 Tax=Graphocephala atropunctata TaxID=36148 RepID=A0A1B6MAG0_9HEMI
MTKINSLLVLTLLAGVLVSAAPEENDSRHLTFEEEEEEEEGDILYGEHLPENTLDLEDHGDLNLSGEMLSENHFWDRKKRSLEAPATLTLDQPHEGKITENFSQEDMETAETVSWEFLTAA